MIFSSNKPNYKLIKCSQCDELLERANKISFATCYECKRKRINKLSNEREARLRLEKLDKKQTTKI